MAKDDLLVMDEDLANNVIENMVISNNFPKDIMEDYLGGSFTYNGLSFRGNRKKKLVEFDNKDL